MTEKLYMVGWNFVELKCGYTHKNKNGKDYNPEMKIVEGTESAYYKCSEEHCMNRLPLLAYEKIMQESIRIINEGLVSKGYTWTVKCARQTYELTVFNFKPDIKITIGVKNLTLLSR